MARETRVHNEPRVSIVGDDVLGGVAFSLWYDPYADLSTSLEAHRLITTSSGSSSWKEYLDDYCVILAMGFNVQCKKAHEQSRIYCRDCG